MWSIYCLLLLSFGVFSTTASNLENAQQFFDGLSLAIKNKDSTAIRSKFADSFVMHGCNFTVEKEDAVKYLSGFKDVPAVQVIPNSISESKLKRVKGSLNDTSNTSTEKVELVFYLDETATQLTSCFISECVRFPYGPHGSLPFDKMDPNDVGKEFLTKFNVAIKTNNQSALKEFFTKEFEYNSCGKMISEVNFEKSLAQPSNNPQFRLNSSRNIGGAIRLIAVSEGSDTLVEYYLNRLTGKLESGYLMTCTKSSKPDYQIKFPNATEFLKMAEKQFATRDPFLMMELFNTHFQMETCIGSYDKTSTLLGIAGLPKEKEVKFELESAEQMGGSFFFKVKIPVLDSKQYEMWTSISNRYGPQIRSARAIGC